MKAIANFYDRGGSLCRCLNTSFVALIPKKHGIFEPNDFCPISLLNCFDKILSKILACRMEQIMGLIISTTPKAFVRGR